MEKILVKTKEFGEISKSSEGEFILTDAQKYALLEKCGLENAKEVCKAVDKAKQAAMVEVFKFLGDQVLATKQSQSLVAGTGSNWSKYTIDAKKDVTIPGKEGETPRTETRYGYCTYKERARIPDALKREGGELYAIAAEIEKVMK